MVKLRFIQYFCVVMLLTAFEPELGQDTIMAAEPVPASKDDVQVLASGPIHEAFAEAVQLDPEPGIVVPKAPPRLIEEIPPRQRPEGDVQWIPGYWGWDDDRNDYIWVSGVWRVPPPDRQWIPGYWTSVREGYQWISGYWAGAKDEETEYLPEPPESVEIGPSSNAPSPDYIWMPGCWVWRAGRYAWRPGYWAIANPDWVWVPAHYMWTPRGYVFVGGYWDYIVIHRGVLFAPVFFPRVHLGLTISFSPGFVISLNIFDDALFIRPRYGHYYYGDYYASRYYRRGIYPWFSLHARRVVYEPIYAHQRWNHRHDKEWENRLQKSFHERREDERLKRPNSVMPLNRAEKNKIGSYRLQTLSKRERRDFTQREKEVRTYQRERQGREVEEHRILQEKASKISEPSRVKFSRSPITDRPNAIAHRRKAPPAQYITPKPNPNVEPLKREYGFSRSEQRSRNREEEERKPDEDRRQRSIDRDQKSRKGGR